MNQYTKRTVPGYATVSGRANAAATVTVNNQPVIRHGRTNNEFFVYEQSVSNNTAAVLQGITNVGVINPVSGQDIIVSNITSQFIPRTPELFAYDADGNLTNNGRWSLSWDAENRLIGLESTTNVPAASRQKLAFTYDWQNRRSSKSVWNWNTTTNGYQHASRTVFFWDGTRLQAELETNSLSPTYLLPRQWYIWGLDSSGTLDGAGGVGGLLAVKYNLYYTDGRDYFCGSDAQGNITTLVDQWSGSIAGRIEYGPFGEKLRAAGPGAGIHMKWSSKYEDDETGFVYYNERYYDPITGGWLSRDPTGENGGPNVYGFCGNDGINHYDSNGELWWPVTGAASMGFGWVLAKATGTEYNVRDAAIDFALGAAGPGLFGQFAKLAKLRKCIKIQSQIRAIKTLELTTKLERATEIDKIAKVVTQVKKITKAEAKVQAVIDGKAYDLAIGFSLVATKTVGKRILHGVNHLMFTQEAEATLDYETKGDGAYKATIIQTPIKTQVTTDPPSVPVNPDGPPLIQLDTPPSPPFQANPN